MGIDKKKDFEWRFTIQVLGNLVEKIGHAHVREVFNTNRLLRNKGFKTHFPVSLLYRLSLCKELDNSYSTKTIQEIADEEGLKKRYVYRLYHQKKDKDFEIEKLEEFV